MDSPSPTTPVSGAELVPGKKIGGGRYALINVLGQGGMGVVWLAQDERLNEQVALKFLPAEIRSDAAALDDMRRETQKSRKLTHPNIVRIHDFYEAEGEAPFISMEYVDGPNLVTLRIEQSIRVLSWDFLSPLVKQLCDALDYAHGEKVIHRDLKPGNVMLDSKGRLKLADFGIAATVSDSMSRVSLKHNTSGTLPYMSPQQLDGKPPRATDDIYALGATLYELLTSRPPFYTGEIAYQVRNLPPDPMEQRLADFDLANEIPPDVATLIMACLAKNPEGRPQSTRAVVEWIGLELGTPKSFQGESLFSMEADSALTASKTIGESGGQADVSSSTEARLKEIKSKPGKIPSGAWLILGMVMLVIGSIYFAVMHPRQNVNSSSRNAVPGVTEQSQGAVATTEPPGAEKIVSVEQNATNVDNKAAASTSTAQEKPQAPDADEQGFVSMFNGRDLSGWGGDSLIWQVKDGAITGELSRELISNYSGNSSSLLWNGGKLDDFELRCSCKIHTYSDRFPASRGTTRLGVKIRAKGSGFAKTHEAEVPLIAISGSSSDAKTFRTNDWNDVWIVVRGNRVTVNVNEVTTHNSTFADVSGRLALYLWADAVFSRVTAQFKNIRLKQLTRATVVSASAKSGEGQFDGFQSKKLTPASRENKTNTQDASSQKDSLKIISTTPTLPATLKIGEQLIVMVQYSVANASKVRVRILPLTRGAATKGYRVSGSPTWRPKSGQGQAKCWIYITEPTDIDEVQIRMDDDRSKKELARITVPLKAQWK